MRAYSTPPPNPQPNSTTSIEPLLRRQDAANIMSKCLRSIDEAIASGDLEIVVIGRSVRIRPSALEAYIEARSTRRNPRRVVRKTTKKTTTGAGGSL
jgi:hypothetical protein